MPVRSHWCDECNVDRLTNQALRRHVAAKHLGSRPFQCQNCPSAFSYQSTLQKHNTQSCLALIQKQMAFGTLIACDRCNYATPIKNRMLMHQMYYCAKRAESNLLRCDQCDYGVTKGAKDKERLTAHVFSNNIAHRSIWMCDQCDQIHQAKHQLKMHIQSKHIATMMFTTYRNKVRACDRCGARNRLHILADHCTIASRKNAPQQLTLTCDLCEYSIKGSGRWRNLSAHILARHFPSLCKQYVCDLCDKGLVDGQRLIKHDNCTIASRKTTPQQLTRTCDLCEYSIKWSGRWSNLSAHILPRHFPSLCKQYVCDLCDKGLVDGQCLIKHLRRGCARRGPLGPRGSRVTADIITTGVKMEIQVGDE